MGDAVAQAGVAAGLHISPVQKMIAAGFTMILAKFGSENPCL